MIKKLKKFLNAIKKIMTIANKKATLGEIMQK
jgi:hypothetical protein